VLKEYIQAGCASLGIPLENVLTYDHWCRLYWERYFGRRMPWNAVSKQPDFDLVRREVARHVRETRPDLYDFVLVDEGQDLDPEVFEILRLVAKHVTAVADHKQQIYERGSAEDEIARALGLSRRNTALLAAYRCSPYIVPLAAACIANAAERQVFTAQSQADAGTRETPVLYLAPDFVAERQRLADAVRQRMARGERVAILLPQKRQVHGFAEGLAEFGIDVELQAGRDGNALDFNTDKPKLITYHSAKGLTFDSVLLPRLVNGSFGRVDEDRLRRLLFVAITRGTNWVYLSAVEGKEIDLLQPIRALGQSGQLTIHRAAEPPGEAKGEPRQPRAADAFDDLF
jgi:superfamily I DNA/RNA helicase